MSQFYIVSNLSASFLLLSWRSNYFLTFISEVILPIVDKYDFVRTSIVNLMRQKYVFGLLFLAHSFCMQGYICAYNV